VSNTYEPMPSRPLMILDQRDQSVPTDTEPPALPGSVRTIADPDVIYRHISGGQPSWISDTDGVHRPLHIARWMGGTASTREDREVDEAILDLCQGPTMDVGCGPGRFTAALAARGVPVLGVDVSRTAVEMTKKRGGPALQGNVFGPMPDAGRWERVLLADGNIGIGGDPLRMLRRARQLLHPRGRVIAEFDARPTGVCTRVQRWETHHHVTGWFPWTHVGSDAAGALAEEAGMFMVDVVERSGRYIVSLGVH
jgi:SAM-dependent methyltransferase